MPADTISRTSVYYALKLDKDVHIPTRDGAYVVADVFRPETDGRFLIIMTMGPYSKDILSIFETWSA
jgi:predicted acyl esterase